MGHVVVGVNTDRFVLSYKGSTPTYTYLERANLIRQMGYDVYPNDGPGDSLIIALHPEYVAIGTDWLKKDYLRQIHMKAHDFERLGIGLVYIPYTEGISTSDIKRRLQANAIPDTIG